VFGRALVQKAASLRGLVQKGLALFEAHFISGACLGDLALKGAGHGRKHPCPCIVGIGMGFRGDPRGPSQDL
jgi:hypothetical protein